MKTTPIIVLRRTDKDRLGADRIVYYDGLIRKQPSGHNFISPASIGGAKVYASMEDAVADRLTDELLAGFEPVFENLWLPQPGEIVVYECQSMISGAWANIRLATVRKMTQRGYVHVERVTEAFNRFLPEKFIQGGRSNFRTFLRPASAEDIANLPAWNDMRGAQALARARTASDRAAAQNRA